MCLFPPQTLISQFTLLSLEIPFPRVHTSLLSSKIESMLEVQFDLNGGKNIDGTPTHLEAVNHIVQLE